MEKKRSRGNPKWKKGISGNPGGRPRNVENITHWLRHYGNLSPAEVGEACAAFAAELKRGARDIPIFAVIAVRALISLMNEADPRLLAVVQDRLEGKLPQAIDVRDWREEAHRLRAEGKLTREALMAEREALIAELDSLADEFFGQRVEETQTSE